MPTSNSNWLGRPADRDVFSATRGNEGLLFQLAAQLEQARPWKDRRPGWCCSTIARERDLANGVIGATRMMQRRRDRDSRHGHHRRASGRRRAVPTDAWSSEELRRTQGSDPPDMRSRSRTAAAAGGISGRRWRCAATAIAAALPLCGGRYARFQPAAGPVAGATFVLYHDYCRRDLCGPSFGRCVLQGLQSAGAGAADAVEAVARSPPRPQRRYVGAEHGRLPLLSTHTGIARSR